jgi:hypothetical protein
MNRRAGILCLTGLSAFLLCGSTAPATCKENIGPSNGEVYGIAAGVAAGLTIGIIVLVEVHKSHHQIKGCVSTGPTGLEVENESDHKIYTLTGASTSLKAGDIVKVKGNKEKQPKGVTANHLFQVEKMSRDYGPCKVPAAAPATQP